MQGCGGEKKRKDGFGMMKKSTDENGGFGQNPLKHKTYCSIDKDKMLNKIALPMFF